MMIAAEQPCVDSQKGKLLFLIGKDNVEGVFSGCMADPDDIAWPVAFLASDLAAHITGEIVNVNGGAVLCG